ncbi:MAG TPA: GNAT family N-acetyltransferase [Candidatus Onthocola stercorigallinarum]|nr:GNAT family N-acetyltransferase [Candidatus Onthocola stercorigallinarum]
MIREMNLNDYEDVRILVRQIHELHLSNRPDIYNDGESFPKEYFEKVLSDANNLNYVYIENKKIVGVLNATLQHTNPLPIIKPRTYYFIENLVVDKNHRRKGIAKKLFSYLTLKAKENNIDSIELNVWSFNTEAIKFYESMGMNIKNIRMEIKSK